MKKAFSIPEVLITLTIVGIVSALLLPSLIRDFNERMNSYKEANVANKITQAMEHMNAEGDLNYYKTTEDFVEALSKHLKIAKICDNEHLTDCWSSKIVKTADGSDYEVKDAKTGKKLHTPYTTNTVGIVLVDGTQIILAYDPSVGASAGENIKGSKKTLPVGGGKSKEFAYTTSITSGIDYVVDVNGPAGPNAETTDGGFYNDIRSFRYASFSNAGCRGEKYGTLCLFEIESFPPISCADDKNSDYCGSKSSGFVVDYWAGAQKACADLGMKLPTYNEYSGLCSSRNNFTKTFKQNLYATSSDYSTTTYIVGQCSSNTNGYSMGFSSKGSLLPIICIGD